MSGRLTILLLLVAVAGAALVLFADAFVADDSLSSDDPGSRGAGEPSYLEADGSEADDTPGLEAMGQAGGRPRKRRAGDAPPVARSDVQPTPVTVRFRGRVRGAAGQIAAHARVRLVGPGGTFEVETDAQGNFEQLLPPGRYRAFLDGGDAGVLHLAALVVDGATGPGAPVGFELEEAASLDVTVLRLGDAPEGEGDPMLVTVPDAAVAVVNPEAGMLRREALTGGAGVAVFDGLIPGAHNVEVRIGDGPLLRQVAVAKADERVEVEVRVPESVTLRGKVTSGKDGPGISQATIRIRVADALSGATHEVEFGTLYDGSFETEVPRGIPEWILVRAAGHAPLSLVGRRRTLGSIRGLRGSRPVTTTIALEPGIELAGSLEDATGRPLGGIDLAIRPTSTPEVRVTTAPDGTFLAQDLAPGYVGISVATSGWFFASGSESSLRLTSEMAPRFTHAPLVLVEGLALQGRVLDPMGKSVAGARVWLVSARGLPLRIGAEQGQPWETFTDGAGGWRFEGLPPDMAGWNIRAALGAQQSEPMRLEQGAAAIDLKLAPTGVLTGIVLDQGTGMPIPGARVRVHPDLFWLGYTVEEVVTDETGTFRFAALLPGPGAVEVTCADYVALIPRPRVTVSATVPGEVRLALDPGLVFAGLCVNEQGEPLRLAKIQVRGRTGPRARAASRVLNTDARGAFRAGGFPPGNYEIRALKTGYKMLVRDKLTETNENLRFVLKKP